MTEVEKSGVCKLQNTKRMPLSALHMTFPGPSAHKMKFYTFTFCKHAFGGNSLEYIQGITETKNQQVKK